MLDYAGVAVFAAAGSLAASRKQLDIIGFIFFATITGIGGGTLRDVLLDNGPIFWVANPAYILVCASIAIIAYFTAHLIESRYKVLLWLDAIGISAYAVMGSAKGYAATGSVTVAILMGVMTATFGGILRDVLANETSVLLRPEIYVTATMLGAGAYIVTTILGLEVLSAAAVGFSATIIVRGGALIFGWSMPTYKARPGRDPDDIL